MPPKAIRRIRFELSNGAVEQFELSPADACQGRAMALFPPEAASVPFLYPPSERRNETALKRIGEMNALVQRQFVPGLPNVLFPDDRLVLADEIKFDLFRLLLPQLAGKVNAVFFPNRGRNCRKLCDYLYPFLRCRPSLMVFGMGMEDHATPAAQGLPEIDIDEYRYRMDWLFDMVRTEFGIPLLAVVNPPASRPDGPAATCELRPAWAAPYVETLTELCQQYGVPTFDARTYYPKEPLQATYKDPWVIKLTQGLAAAVVQTVAAASGRKRGAA